MEEAMVMEEGVVVVMMKVVVVVMVKVVEIAFRLPQVVVIKQQKNHFWLHSAFMGTLLVEVLVQVLLVCPHPSSQSLLQLESSEVLLLLDFCRSGMFVPCCWLEHRPFCYIC